MIKRITVQGLDFICQDREREIEAVASAIEDALLALPASEVLSMHVAATWDAEQDAFTDPDDTRASEFSNQVCRATLRARGWEKPDFAFVSMVAVNS